MSFYTKIAVMNQLYCRVDTLEQVQDMVLLEVTVVTRSVMHS